MEQARLEGFAAFAVANESVVLDEGVQGLLGLLDSSENAFRPHQSLGERTPAERFRLRIVEAPEPVVQDPVETSEDAVARVRPDGGLRPDGRTDCPPNPGTSWRGVLGEDGRPGERSDGERSGPEHPVSAVYDRE